MRERGTHHPTSGLHEPGSTGTDSDPLVRLTVIRSFAHKSEKAVADHGIARSPALKAQRGHAALLGGSSSGAPLLGDPLNSVGDTSFENAGSLQIGNILSFKQVSLELAPVDFTAHENFLTAVFNFALQLPLEDISQVGLPGCPRVFGCMMLSAVWWQCKRRVV